MSRLGYHYYPDDQHFTRRELDHWLPILRSLGAGWLVLTGSHLRSVPEPFITGLVEAGVEPVVRIPVPVGAVTPADLEPLFHGYARWGVRYVAVFDCPNLRSGWAQDSDWGRPGLIDRFLDRVLPMWEAERAAGLKPVFPALEPGGDYWDTAFLEAALRGLVQRGAKVILAEMTLAIFGWTFGRPLDWGGGGPGKWPEARPYHTPHGCQDQRGLRLYEWHRAAAARAGAPSMPMIVLAGGALPGEGEADPSGEVHAERNLSIARLVTQGEIPGYIQSFAFFLLGAPADHALAHAAWFPATGAPRPVVGAFQTLAASLDRPTAGKNPRPIRHYLLLDPSSPWAMLGDFVAAFRPTVGFSLEEARRSEQVSIVGEAFTAEVEDQLKQAGCQVQRISLASLARRPAPKSTSPRPNNVAAMLSGVIHG